MPRPFLSSLFLTMFASSHGLGSHGDLIKSLVDARILKSKPAIDAMLAVDRRNYAPARPYNDEPVPLMCGQTISAPHMHAYALEALLPNVVVPNANVLDVGSGSGYFTVLLARANAHARVHGIEVVPDLVHLSIRNAQAQDGDLLASGKLSFQEVDGWQGLPQAAPFDAIHVGAAAETLPEVHTHTRPYLATQRASELPHTEASNPFSHPHRPCACLHLSLHLSLRRWWRNSRSEDACSSPLAAPTRRPSCS